MTKALTPSQQVDAIEAYQINLEPMQSIAARYGITRQAVYKLMVRNGVSTSGGAIPVTCSACGKEIHRARCQVRKRKNLFCDHKCYYAFLEAGNGNGPYKQNSQGQRIARSKVADVFDLRPGHVVHHIDRNCLNNRLDNLMVFANQGDHIRYHRLGPDYAAPIWDGSK